MRPFLSAGGSESSTPATATAKCVGEASSTRSTSSILFRSSSSPSDRFCRRRARFKSRPPTASCGSCPMRLPHFPEPPHSLLEFVLLARAASDGRQDRLEPLRLLDGQHHRQVGHSLAQVHHAFPPCSSRSRSLSAASLSYVAMAAAQ